MTKSFLLPTGNPNEHHQEHSRGLARAPSSEEISPAKFLGWYRTNEISPPHDTMHEPPDTVSNDEKEDGRKKGKFKNKEK
ncbi:RBP1 protein, partial [Piprites chloris]|nr:RBP1 protein [Piprites chloris]